MTLHWPFIAVLCFLLVQVLCAQQFNDIDEGSDPEQIHLSLGRNPNEIVVTWSTFNPNDISYVQYGTDQRNLVNLVKGYRTKFVDNGPQKRTQYIHRVFLNNLKPFTRYYYRCGSKTVWSKVLTFKTPSNETNWSPRMLVLGDLGVKNGVSIPAIWKEVEEGNVDAIFHNGDFAYDMNTDDGRLGDRFMNQIQPFASKVIYQTSVGNHENKYNFSHYVNRFSMYDMTSITGRKGDFYYAFYLGPSTVIVLNTDVYVYPTFTKADQEAQKDWLEYVLQIANEPENRKQRPWIIVFAHKPLYCTNNSTIDDDCTKWADRFRREFESQLFNYGVDVAIWAHEHTYERTYPVYKSQLWCNISEPYKNPKAPVHLIVGNAGNQEELDDFEESKPWSAFREAQYGYSMLEIVNSTHLVIQHKNTAGPKAGQVIDSVTLVQENHGSFTNY